MCLNSSGLFGFVPSPTCSQGESASKFLRRNVDRYPHKMDSSHT